MSAMIQELFRVGLYKRSQGRITRQVTFGAIAITVLIGLWRMSETLRGAVSDQPLVYYGVPGVLLLAGIWIAYRLVNLPGFADFLIAVEAEMNKVSWPSRGELTRASLVVLVTIVVLGFLLAGFDAFWIYVFRTLGIYAI